MRSAEVFIGVVLIGLAAAQACGQDRGEKGEDAGSGMDALLARELLVDVDEDGRVDPAADEADALPVPCYGIDSLLCGESQVSHGDTREDPPAMKPDDSGPNGGRARVRDNRTQRAVWSLRLSRTAGENDARDDSLYPGGLAAAVSRIQVTPSAGLHASLAAAKQRGEEFRDGFLSGSIGYAGRGVLSQAVAGDYTVSAGEGLVLARSGGRPGNRALRGHRRTGGLAPYRGTGVQGFLRGAALTGQSALGATTVRGTLFLSWRRLNAAVREDGTVSSFDWSGLVRTVSERSKQGTVTEHLIGARLEAGSPGARGGITWYRSEFGRRVEPASGTGFSGSRAEIAGMDGAFRLGAVSLFGECAVTSRGAASGVAAVEVRAPGAPLFTLSLRSYGKDFSSPHAAAFGSHGDGGNERGLYLAWSAGGGSGPGLDGSLDLVRYPAGTREDPLPSTGIAMHLRCLGELDEAVSGVARLRLKRWSEPRVIPHPSGGTVHGRREATLVDFSALLLVNIGARGESVVRPGGPGKPGLNERADAGNAPTGGSWNGDPESQAMGASDREDGGPALSGHRGGAAESPGRKEASSSGSSVTKGVRGPFYLRTQVAWKILSCSTGIHGGRGFMISAGVGWRTERTTAELRCALFEADSFEAALYDAESDAGRLMTGPALYGRGIRYAAVLEWRAGRGIGLSGKCGATVAGPGVPAGAAGRGAATALTLTAAASVSL